MLHLYLVWSGDNPLAQARSRVQGGRCPEPLINGASDDAIVLMRGEGKGEKKKIKKHVT